MRQNWTRSEYRTGRILSPVLTFGWASFVGLSRIHADRHFFTDVAVGALAGTLMAQLYYYLSYESVEPNSDRSTSIRNTPMFFISLPIP